MSTDDPAGLLDLLADLVERGKAERDSAYPVDLEGQDGAAEVCRRALDAKVPPQDVLARGLVPGMRRVGDAFAEGKAFIPQLLMSARAMRAATAVLESGIPAGEVTRRGTVILGTVAGDLHDIGKSVVGMVLEGEGWQVVDLGVDVTADRFVGAVREHPGCHLAMSALLTTTMVHMRGVVEQVHALGAGTAVYVGGAPVTPAFAERIGADGTFPDPHAFARHLAGEA